MTYSVLLALLAIFSLSPLQQEDARPYLTARVLEQEDGLNIPFTIGGWAVDTRLGVGNGPGVDLIQAYEGSNCSGELIAETPLIIDRPDVLDHLSLDESYRQSGYHLQITDADRMQYEVTICARSEDNDEIILSLTVEIELTAPAFLSSPQRDETVGAELQVEGKRLDSTIEDLQLSLDGACDSVLDTEVNFEDETFNAVVDMSNVERGYYNLTLCSATGRPITQHSVFWAGLLYTEGLPRLGVRVREQEDGFTVPFEVGGWAFDPGVGSNNGPGIDRILIYSGSGCSGELIGSTELTINRPDVPAHFGLDESYNLSGYKIEITDIEQRQTQLTVCAQSTDSDTIAAQQTVDVNITTSAFLYSPSSNAIVMDTLNIAGKRLDTSAGEMTISLSGSCATELNVPVEFDGTIFTSSVDMETYDRGTYELLVCSGDGEIEASRTIYWHGERPHTLTAVTISLATLLLSLALFTSYPTSSLRQRIISLFAIAIAIVPVFIITWTVHRYAINAAFRDEWNLTVTVYNDLLNGDFALLDMWKLQNEHRIVFPKVFLIFLAIITDYDTVYRYFINILACVGVVAMLGNLTVHQTKSWVGIGGFVFIAFIMFNYAMIGRWLDVLFTYILCAVVAFTCAVFVATRFPASNRNFVIILSATVIAAISFSTGNAAIVAIAILLWFSEYRRIKYIVPYVLTTGTILGLYVMDFLNTRTITSTEGGITSLVEYVDYILVFIGSPLAPFINELNDLVIARNMGLIGLLLLALFSLIIFLNSRRDIRSTLPWLTVIFWVLLCAIMASYGRVNRFGIEGARAERYMIYSIMFWMSIIALGTIILSQMRSARPPVRIFGYALPSIAFFLIGANLVNANLNAASKGIPENRTQRLVSGIDCLRNINQSDNTCIEQHIHAHQPDFVRQLIPQLEPEHFSFMPQTKMSN